MATDVKKHTTFAAGEVPKRSVAGGAGLTDAILSVNDLVPTANATEQTQVAAGLASTSYPVGPTRPLATTRADARPLHQLEISRDGNVFVPISGVLSFATVAARDSWTSANSALLSPGDKCVTGGWDARWNGSRWIQDTDWTTLPLSSGWSVFVGDTPVYRVQDGILSMRGRVQATSAASSEIALLSSELRPTSAGNLFMFVGWSDTHGIVQLLVGHTSGQVVCVQGVGAARSGISLATISFPVG